MVTWRRGPCQCSRRVRARSADPGPEGAQRGAGTRSLMPQLSGHDGEGDAVEEMRGDVDRAFLPRPAPPRARQAGGGGKAADRRPPDGEAEEDPPADGRPLAR